MYYYLKILANAFVFIHLKYILLFHCTYWTFLNLNTCRPKLVLPEYFKLCNLYSVSGKHLSRISFIPFNILRRQLRTLSTEIFAN